MAYDEKLADRVRSLLIQETKVTEKKMFRGLVFMVNDKMCVNISGDSLMCRIDPEYYEAALEQPGVESVLMGKKIYRGYIYVSPDVLKTKKQLQYWVDQCLAYNPNAKSSKRK